MAKKKANPEAAAYKRSVASLDKLGPYQLQALRVEISRRLAVSGEEQVWDSAQAIFAAHPYVAAFCWDQFVQRYDDSEYYTGGVDDVRVSFADPSVLAAVSNARDSYATGFFEVESLPQDPGDVPTAPDWLEFLAAAQEFRGIVERSEDALRQYGENVQVTMRRDSDEVDIEDSQSY